MVVCNVDRFLAEAVESILGQTFREFEFIIVDFGSSDRTEAIALSYAAKDSRIKLHKIPHCGLTEARNAGCALAMGRYMAIMDADDVSLPNRLLWQVEFAEKHPEVGLLGGATERIAANGRLLCVHEFKTESPEIKSALLTGCEFCQSTVLIRRQAFAFVGGYRAVFVQAEDYDLWLRIAEHFQVANLKQAVVKYRLHSGQISMRKRREQTLCILAAQASALARRNGCPDPLIGVEQITPAVLAGLGVTEARQQNDVVAECRYWIGVMTMAGEYSVALNAALEMLQSDLKSVERWQIAELHLVVARLYWKERGFLNSLAALARAVVTRPFLVGRPVKRLLRRHPLVGESWNRAGESRKRG